MPITDFVAGQTPNAADLNRYLMQQAHVIKPGIESVTSSTTLQNDDHLFLNVSANTDYWVQAFIIYNGATGGDLQIGWSAPTGSTFDWVSDGLSTAATTSTDEVSRTAQGVTNAPSVGAVGSGNNCTVSPKGLLRVGANSGTLRLRWAQSVSSGTATQVTTNSFLMARRLTY
ncbi:hypothetical protein [Planobispora rosea]|uniref:hypothetical protein n=1 Tax=Planobispora rosea TaxID=35762 RepID=UPI00083B22EA|nr:hypothetical protein [Planobispora rosea]